MLYKAKTLVTYDGILRQIGDVFEVKIDDARAFGWTDDNSVVEPFTGGYEQPTDTTSEVVPQTPDVTPTQPTDTTSEVV